MLATYERVQRFLIRSSMAMMSFMSIRGRAHFSKASQPLTPKKDATGVKANHSYSKDDIIRSKYPVLSNIEVHDRFCGRPGFPALWMSWKQ